MAAYDYIYDEMNAEVALWAKLTRRKLIRQVGALTLKDKIALHKRVWNKANDLDYKPLDKSIGVNTRKSYGQINRINFRFPRQGIFLERGAGRGRTLGTGAKPWIVPKLDPAIEELASIIVEKYADIAMGEIKFIVPGIIAKRINIRNNG